jgi:hypothetical protein
MSEPYHSLRCKKDLGERLRNFTRARSTEPRRDIHRQISATFSSCARVALCFARLANCKHRSARASYCGTGMASLPSLQFTRLCRM